jgi:hypothetical protein
MGGLCPPNTYRRQAHHVMAYPTQKIRSKIYSRITFNINRMMAIIGSMLYYH